MASLILRSGPRAGERIEIVGELVVGREHADVTIEDPELSRRHLAVRERADGVELEDLGSTNGTIVDGAQIDAPVTLHNSAIVMIGETEVEVEIELPAPAEDPGATRMRARPPAPDATVLRSTPSAPPPDATVVGVTPPPPPPQPIAAPPTTPMRATPAPAAPAAPLLQPFGAFEPASSGRRHGGAAATRLLTPAVLVVLVIVATAVALVIYFGAR